MNLNHRMKAAAGRPPAAVTTVTRLVLSAALAVSLAACGADSGEGAAASGGSAGDGTVEGKTVELIGPLSASTEPLYDKVVAGLEEQGIEVTLRGHAYELPANIKEFDAAVAAKPDAILLVPMDATALAPGAARAKAANVPVILAQVPFPDNESAELFAGDVAPDDKAAGRKAVEALVQGLEAAGHDEGNIVLVNGGNTIGSLVRFAEINEVLKEYPQYEVAAEVSNPAYDAPGTMKLVQPILAQYSSKGGIVGGIGFNGAMAQGIAQAAEQANVPLGVDKGGMIIADTICSVVSLEQLTSGAQYSSIAFPTSVSADAYVDYLVKLLKGEDVPKAGFIPAGDVLTVENANEELCG